MEKYIICFGIIYIGELWRDFTMELRKTANGKSFIIEIERKKSSNSKRVMRIVSMLLGISGFSLLLLLFITILGIAFGIPLAIASIGLIAGSLGYQHI